MIGLLRDLVDQLKADAPEAAPSTRHSAIRVSTAVLMVEIARADAREQVIESEAIFDLLRDHFRMDAEAVEALMAYAEDRLDEAVSLHSFTRTLHEHLSVDEKLAIVEMLWRVAFADSKLDRYEDYVVRKIADLLYVSPSDVIRLRNRVMYPGP